MIYMMGKKNGQTWSIDVIIGVIIFMLIIAVFYAFISSRSEPTVDDLGDDARVISTKLSSDGVISAGSINRADIDTLCDMSYEDVKAQLGITSDFCIYLEDSNGNLIPCGTAQKSGIGNAADVNLSGSITCGAPLP